MARLVNPLTGLAVEAEGEVAERLRERGFRPEGAQPPRSRAQQRKAAPKRKATD